jgi:hypothetical protein
MDETGAKVEELETRGGRRVVSEADLRQTADGATAGHGYGGARVSRGWPGRLLRGVVRMTSNWAAWVGG